LKIDALYCDGAKPARSGITVLARTDIVLLRTLDVRQIRRWRLRKG
jgi:hypothetical protein